jgi:hypothetical protein
MVKMNVIDYITITSNLKKWPITDYIKCTWKNVIDYNWIRLQITITPCLVPLPYGYSHHGGYWNPYGYHQPEFEENDT